MRIAFTDFWNQVLEKIEEKHCFVYAIFTDQVILEKWDVEVHKSIIEKNVKKLLEIRLFSNEIEYKACRGDIGEEDFFYRDTADYSKQDYFDENHYRKEDKDQKIVIRNYLSYYEKTGQAYVVDWRFVQLTSKGGE